MASFLKWPNSSKWNVSEPLGSPHHLRTTCWPKHAKSPQQGRLWLKNPASVDWQRNDVKGLTNHKSNQSHRLRIFQRKNLERSECSTLIVSIAKTCFNFNYMLDTGSWFRSSLHVKWLIKYWQWRARHCCVKKIHDKPQCILQFITKLYHITIYIYMVSKSQAGWYLGLVHAAKLFTRTMVSMDVYRAIYHSMFYLCPNSGMFVWRVNNMVFWIQPPQTGILQDCEFGFLWFQE